MPLREWYSKWENYNKLTLKPYIKYPKFLSRLNKVCRSNHPFLSASKTENASNSISLSEDWYRLYFNTKYLNKLYIILLSNKCFSNASIWIKSLSFWSSDSSFSISGIISSTTWLSLGHCKKNLTKYGTSL